MATGEQTSALRTRTRTAPTALERLTGGGTVGNERLTAATGAVLIILLAALGVTILRLRPLLSEHLFLGMLLIPPVLLKMATTGYRFARYYTGSRSYVRKGPPAALLRAIAPMVILSTLVVFASGVALLFVGPSSRSTLLPIHKVSFIIWVGFTAVHVLGHLPGLGGILRADYGPSRQFSNDVTGRTGRTLALGGAIAAGVLLAVLVIPEFNSWLHWSSLFHGGDR